MGGKTNLSYNCLDRHVLNGKRDKTAILWEGEPGEFGAALSYGELLAEVSKFANALKSLGVKKGDRVAIYMGMTPELAVALLACARIGAVHSVIFGGFAAHAIVDRAGRGWYCVAVITQDGSYRRGGEVKLKATVDEALGQCPSVKSVVVYKRTGSAVTMAEGRDHWWHDVVAKASDECPAEEMDSEDPLYILYTSGTTGKPKGLVHTTGGYQVQTYYTSKLVFDLKDDDVYWCSADIGWVTGHSYVVYGLQNSVTTPDVEGAPNFPAWDRLWKIIDDHKATIFYTAPTAIRAFMKNGDEHVKKHNLKSLRLIGTVGEPINPEAWMWYREVVGKGRCPIIDTWWQTETGSAMITPLPGAIPIKTGIGDTAVSGNCAGGGNAGRSGSRGDKAACW